ncbi:MAG: hypothetical protein L3J04_05445 [Robiginitomaculum sp.]|nr:hypothetical protein [Robiginitomaculum sp.]
MVSLLYLNHVMPGLIRHPALRVMRGEQRKLLADLGIENTWLDSGS